MLQEGHIWTREKQERWQKTREKGCLNYVLKMTAMAFSAAVAVSIIYAMVSFAGGQDFHWPTALCIPVLGVISGLITGRSYWGLSESSFHQMNSR